MTDRRRNDLKRQWLLLLLLCVSFAGLAAQCTESPVFADLPTEQVRGCDQFSLATLPGDGDACYQTDAVSGEIIEATLSAELRAALAAGGTILTSTSGCGGTVEICVADEQLTNNPTACSGLVQIRRTYQARNLAANSNPAPASFAQIIAFERPQLDELEISPTAIFFIPDTGGGLPENPAPRSEDFPFLNRNGQDIHLAADLCQFSVAYQDGPRNTGCGNNFNFIRTYTVADGCDGNDNRVYTQVVRVGDQQSQTITPPLQVQNPLQFFTNTDCGSIFDTRLTGLSISDICDGSSALDAYVYLNGDLSSTPMGPYAVFGPSPQPFTDPIPLGQHIIRYLGQDSYGSTTTLDIDFEIVDNTPPEAVCVPSLAVALNASGEVTVTAQRLDAGSNDLCSAVSLGLARADASASPTGNFVPALILDCGDEGITSLILEVTDATGRNRSHCAVEVTIVDITRPTCTPPPAVTLTCRAFTNNLPQDIVAAFTADPTGTSTLLDATLGAAAGEDNCGNLTIEQSVSGILSSCGTGRITRLFTVADGTGFIQNDPCQQIIDVQQYTEYSLQF
ncbi:MAG: hypothetical protein AAF840_00630, partial [Bacteroidota bacterium]